MILRHLFILFFIAAVFSSSIAQGQEDAPGLSQVMSTINEVATADAPLEENEFLNIGIREMSERKMALWQPEVRPADVSSVFFSKWQLALFDEAERGFLTRPPPETESQKQQEELRQPGIREISLGGILYSAPEDWTIWLNGQRVTPKALPDQILDIKVKNTHIDLKWLDRYRDLVYPIRLRPHQRFNLDTRMFLPGEGSNTMEN